MRKSWDLTRKILTKEKKIESRWYKSKYSPWDKIKPGEIVFFKDSGCPVEIKAEVEKVEQFKDLNQEKVKEILCKYGRDDGLNDSELEKYFNLFKDKRYCILIFLKNPEKVYPFNINKKGFGAMASWICVDDVNKIKK
ncbi:MAG: hypothetical protein AABW58_04825 [Nanoarchaeota archaeon]